MAVRRGVGLVIVLLVFAFAVSIGGLVAIWLMLGAEPAVPSRATLVLRIDADPVEGGPDDGLRQLLPVSRTYSVRALVSNIRKAKADRRVTALLVRPNSLTSPYLAKVQEVRDAILDFRKSGKPAVAYLESGGQTEYYLATACDRIYLAPSSPLQLTGMAAYSVFLRGTLDTVGAYADLLHIGAYKTAPNQFTEKAFTPAHREMEESLNADSYEQLVAAIAAGRKKTEAEVRALIDDGPFQPADALRAGLVDEVVYEDEVADKARVPLGRGQRIDLAEYDKVSPASVGLNRGPRVAIIYASGVIVSGRSGYDPLNGPVVGSDTLIESIRKVREASDIRGVIVRIDSPGGSAVASDVLWRELCLLRDAKPQRPLVVSMSDLAASGGYYIAMAAPQIVAEPATLTGSIGIYGGKVVTGGVFAKLGANIEGVSRGRNADMNSPTRRYNDAERAKVAGQLQQFYDQFVERVAAARGMTPEQVDRIAQGRVWSGRQAKQNGLVDALGGLETAVALVRQKAKITEAEVELVVYPPRKTLYEMLSGQLGAAGGRPGLEGLLRPAERRAIGIAAAPWTLFSSGEALALMPYGHLR